MKKSTVRVSVAVGILAIAIILLSFTFWGNDVTGPGGTPQQEEDDSTAPTVTAESSAALTGTPDTRIRLAFDGGEVIVKMYDNPTSRDFLAMLPLTLTFEDYSGTEKISDLPERLSIQDAPAGSDPSPGDLTYYSPWGNLAIFYRDFGYSEGLVKLGTIESGVEKLGEIDGDFTVKIERIE